jgi:hypothetical protein
MVSAAPRRRFTVVNSGTKDCLTDIGEGRPAVALPCRLGAAQNWEITQR